MTRRFINISWGSIWFDPFINAILWNLVVKKWQISFADVYVNYFKRETSRKHGHGHLNPQMFQQSITDTRVQYSEDH